MNTTQNRRTFAITSRNNKILRFALHIAILCAITTALLVIKIFNDTNMSMDIDSYESGHVLAPFIDSAEIAINEVYVGNERVQCDYAQHFTETNFIHGNWASGIIFIRNNTIVLLVEEKPRKRYFFNGRWNHIEAGVTVKVSSKAQALIDSLTMH